MWPKSLDCQATVLAHLFPGECYTWFRVLHLPYVRALGVRGLLTLIQGFLSKPCYRKRRIISHARRLRRLRRRLIHNGPSFRADQIDFIQ